MRTPRLARRGAGLLLPIAALAAVAVLPAASSSRTDRADRMLLTATITPGTPNGSPSSLHLFGFNDFHGNISSGGGSVNGVPAGGAPQFFKVLRDLRVANPSSATVAAGDLVGASPIESGQFRDEPSLDIYSLMGVDYSSVGNHEFDLGREELLRKQNGGCNSADAKTCLFSDPNQASNPQQYRGTTMKYLSANVKVGSSTDPSLFPPSAVITRGGQKIALIGETLRDTPSVVTPAGVAGLTFTDEADTANAEVDRIKAADPSIKTFVLLVHQGGFQGNAGFNDCDAAFQTNPSNSAILDVVNRLRPEINVVISAHSHQAYNCSLSTPSNGTKLVTSAGLYGRYITDVGLTLNPDGSLVSATATNNVVGTTANTLSPGADPTYDKVKADVDAANSQVAAVKNRVVGRVNGPAINGNNPAPSGETALGDVIADAQLADTRGAGAQIAFMNPGGIRNTKLLPNSSTTAANPADVTYGMLFNVQPFNNGLTTKTFTGAQIKQLLEQQYVGCFGQTSQRVLQISATLRYTYDQNRPTCNRVDPLTLKLDGTVISAADSVRVTMNSFLASGGDGFTTFNAGTASQTGDQDIDALEAYFTAANTQGVSTTAQNRISFVAAAPAAAVPESTLAVGLPVLALLVAGGGVAIATRRRRPA